MNCSWILIFLLLAASYGNAARIAQSKQCQDWVNYLSAYTCSFRSPTTEGNAVIVFALGATGVTSITVTDSGRNQYIRDLDYNFPGAGQRIVFASAAGARSTQSITLTMNARAHYQAVLLEVNGLATSDPFRDRTATNDNGYHGDCSGGFPFTSGQSLPTSQASEFLVGWNEQAYPNVMTFTDNSPWILVEEEPLGGSRIAYREVNAVGAYAFTGHFSGAGSCDVGAAVLTYRSATSEPTS